MTIKKGISLKFGRAQQLELWWAKNADEFLLSAEFPYYRVNPDKWTDLLKKLKTAGINTISFYIPWNLHEYKKGCFDFSGTTNDRRRNVRHFSKLVVKTGMRIIAKPGPFICAEYHHGAIPDWLPIAHPEIIMKDYNGTSVRFFQDNLPLPYYLHPTYVTHVRDWYRAVAKGILLALQRSGMLTAVQIENEIPYSNPSLSNPFSWGYSEAGTRDFQVYLRNRYRNVQKLNNLMKTTYKSFEEITPPQPLQLDNRYNKENWLFLKDWIEFKEYIGSETINRYKELMQESGVKPSLLYHDLIMLENESPVNYRKMAKAATICPNFWPEKHPAYDLQSYSRVLGRIKLVKGVQSSKACYCSESNWSWGSEAEFSFLFSSLLSEAEGINIYCGVDGKEAGFIGEFPASNIPEPYPGQALITADGEETDKYRTLERLAFFIHSFEAELTSAQQNNQIAITHYTPYNFPYILTRWTNCSEKQFSQLFTDVPNMNGWLYDITSHLIRANLGYDIIDLEGSTYHDLLKYKIIFVPCYEIMDKNIQVKLLRYVDQGGFLFLSPNIPQFDSSFQSCEILKLTLLGNMRIRRASYYHNFTWEGYGNSGTYLGSANLVETYSPEKCHPVGRLIHGNPIALEARQGKGQVNWLGINLPDLPEVSRFVRWLAERQKVLPVIQVAVDDVHGIVKEKGNDRFLFLVNRGSNDFSGPVAIRGTSKQFSLQVGLPARRITILYLKDEEVRSCFLPGKHGYISSSQGDKIFEVKDGSAVFVRKDNKRIKLIASAETEVLLSIPKGYRTSPTIIGVNDERKISSRIYKEKGVLHIKTPASNNNLIYELNFDSKS